MKKVISVLMILVMIMALAACGKKEDPSDSGNAAVTQAEENKKDTEPTKASEPTPEPTKEVTPEPTLNPEDDEFYGFGQIYAGVYLCDNGWSLTVEPEGAAAVINVFGEHTDMETFGSYHEFWTNFNKDTMVFSSFNEVYHYVADEMTSDVLDVENTFEVIGDRILWINEDMEFVKYSDDTSDNPNYVGGNYFSGDVGDGFGAEFILEQQETVDVIGTTFYGVYCECWDYSADSFYYPYYGNEMSMDTMDEFNAAFLKLGTEDDLGEFCFLATGINSDVTWSMEDGRLIMTNINSGDIYEGLFYWDTEGQKMYVCVRVEEYDVWMTADTEIIAPAEEPGEDDTDPEEYKVDALGNGPDVYDYDYSRYESLILSVIDMGIYYRMKIDVLDKYRVDADMIESLHVGDMLNLDGKWVTVTHIYSMDEDYNYTVDHDSFEEGCRVIVMPEKITDFYFPAEIEEAGFDENPESAEFGFVYNSYEECYIAYSDWAWDDCYVEMNYVMLYGVNLAVNESTVVHPAYYDTSRYGSDLTLTGGEFMRLRESKEEQDNRGIHFYDGITYRITLEYDAEGRATGSVADIQEVYTP